MRYLLQVSNFTVINVALRWGGFVPEGTLAFRLLVLQVCCSLLAFVVRYGLARLFFERVE